MTEEQRELLKKLAEALENADDMALCELMACPKSQEGKGCVGCIGDDDSDLLDKSIEALREVARG